MSIPGATPGFQIPTAFPPWATRAEGFAFAAIRLLTVIFAVYQSKRDQNSLRY